MRDADPNFETLRLRMTGIRAQLDGDWSEKLDTQLHLDQDTAECAYWHAGYHQALADVLNFMAKTSAISGIEDTASPYLAAG